MIYSRIVGTGSYLPPRVMTNADFAARLDTTDAWIRERTGIVQRHIAEKSQTSSDLAAGSESPRPRGGRRERRGHGSHRGRDLDPDYVFPSTACLLQSKLGVKGSAAFDVQAVCSGFVYGLAGGQLHQGQEQHEKSPGRRRRSVLAHPRLERPRHVRALRRRSRRSGACGGKQARRARASARRRQPFRDALGAGNVCGGAVAGSPFLQMNGQAVFKFAVRVLEESARETVARPTCSSRTSTG